MTTYYINDIKRIRLRCGNIYEVPLVNGLLSKENIEALTSDGYEYILDTRPRSESDNMKVRILSLDLKYGDTEEIDKSNGVRLILSSSEKRAHKDKRMHEKELARLQKSKEREAYKAKYQQQGL
ncbi:hypothetical protein [Prevotella intermedia]|uniref:hypothetical protein n=1 Tax=Prevotella intermedia TaxID=28131 RepID=UPI000BEAC24A|nr:hypothetical protein [Prevotella intermedia]